MEKENGSYYYGVIQGLGFRVGVFWDNGKENGSYYSGVIQGLGFRVILG